MFGDVRRDQISTRDPIETAGTPEAIPGAASELGASVNTSRHMKETAPLPPLFCQDPALCSSEERFRWAIEGLLDAFTIMSPIRDGDGRIVDYRMEYANRVALQMAQKPREDYIGHRLSELFSQESQAAFVETYSHALETGQPIVVDGYKYKDEVGIYRSGLWLDIRISSLGDSIAVAWRDVTERKQAEEERETALGFLRLVNGCSGKREMVRATLRFLQETWDCEAVGIRLKEGDDYPYYEYRGFSREFIEMENSLCSRDGEGQLLRDSQGRPSMDCMCGNVICGRFDPTKSFFSPQGSFWTNSTMKFLATTTEAERQGRTRNRCNGEGYESVALIPMRAGDEPLGLLQFNDRRNDRFTPGLIALWERLAGYLAVALAKCQAEEAQRESDSLLRLLTDAIPACVAYIGRDGRFRLVNRNYERWFGKDTDWIRDRKMHEVIHPATWKVVEPYVTRVMTGETVSFEVELPVPGTNPRWMHVTYVPDRDPSGLIRGFVAHLADISTLKETSEELRQAKETAEAASGAKSRFLANMCHELRTPLSGVIGGIEIAMADPLPAVRVECLRIADQSAHSLVGIINDILDISKIEAGHLSIAEEALNLRECVSSAIDPLAMEARRKGLVLSEEVEGDVPETVIGDALRLRQVLLNLIGNAIKFTNRGGVKVRVAAGDQVPSGKRNIAFTIADSGIGIPEDKRHLLFQSFSQIDDSTTRRYGGTGLGLAISKQIVEHMGGTITVNSQEGLGSIFAVVVPLAEPSVEAQGPLDPPVPESQCPMDPSVIER